MTNKYYRIFHNGKLMAYGSANRWQVIGWRRMGYDVIEAIS